VIGPWLVFTCGFNKLAALTVRHAVPAIWQDRDFPAAGGLMSYGSDIPQQADGAGRDPRTQARSGTAHSTALFGGKCQSFLDNLISLFSAQPIME
jgi:hypothetical protein